MVAPQRMYIFYLKNENGTTAEVIAQSDTMACQALGWSTSCTKIEWQKEILAKVLGVQQPESLAIRTSDDIETKIDS